MVSLDFTVTTSLLNPARNAMVRMVSLVAGGATATLEVFDGIIGIITGTAVDTAGTGYEVGDVLTIQPLGGYGEAATFEVATVDTGGEVLTVTMTNAGHGFVAGNYETTTDSELGDGAIIEVTTVEDHADTTSVAKLSAVANTQEEVEIDDLTTRGISVKITGSGAQGYVYKD